MAPWLLANESRTAVRSWQQKEREENKEIDVTKKQGEWGEREHFGHSCEVFSAGQRTAGLVGEEQSEPKACLSMSYGLPCAAQVTFSVQLLSCWCYTWLATVQIFMRLNKRGRRRQRERERERVHLAPHLSSSNFRRYSLPLSAHRPLSCMGVYSMC